MNSLRDTFAPITHEAYTIKAARYAEGKVAIRCLDGSGGLKGRAALTLKAVAPLARYSGRELAYICTPVQARRFVEAYGKASASS